MVPQFVSWVGLPEGKASKIETGNPPPLLFPKKGGTHPSSPVVHFEDQMNHVGMYHQGHHMNIHVVNHPAMVGLFSSMYGWLYNGQS